MSTEMRNKMALKELDDGQVLKPRLELARRDLGRALCYACSSMRAVVSIAGLAILALPVLAARIAAPLPPPSPYADTESVTNVTFCAGVQGDNVFSLSIEMDVSPSNNVEVAFGCDENGNGTLDDSEAAFAVGWDCGEWFFRDIASDIADSCAGSCGRRKLDWDLRLDNALAPKALRVRVDGEALPFSMISTMYDPSWNMARVTARGSVDAETVIRFGAFADALVIRIR